MQRIVTLTARKAIEAARRRAAAAAVVMLLADYAAEHGGRFLLYGSAARGALKYNSDIDLLVDFPDESLADAWNFAEAACWDHGVEPDLMPYGWCKREFLEHVAPDLQVIDGAGSKTAEGLSPAVPRAKSEHGFPGDVLPLNAP